MTFGLQPASLGGYPAPHFPGNRRLASADPVICDRQNQMPLLEQACEATNLEADTDVEALRRAIWKAVRHGLR